MEDMPCTDCDDLHISSYPHQLPVPREATNFAEALARILWVLNVPTEKAAAKKLGVLESSFSDAHRRQTIPAEWLVRLQLGWNISSLWILTGWIPSVRPGFLVPDDLDDLMRRVHL